MHFRRLVRKLRKSFRYGEKGFTLIELLIVVAILGILAAVVLPNVGNFLRSGNLAAANSEVASVKTAAAAYYAGSSPATWPTSSSMLTAYLDRPTKDSYTLSTGGQITGVGSYWTGQGLTWNSSNQSWQ